MRAIIFAALAGGTLLTGCADTYGPNSSGYSGYSGYDWNRPDPRYNGYYADRYYRDGQNYQQYSMSRNDRVYRGKDGRYYCRRSDGTTGLIVGAAAGGTLGAIIAPGGSEVLGALIGGAAGAAIGSSVDKGEVRCR